MRIQNNITAMNTHRMYTINNDNVAKSAEKLSSGYRINRAGDDAAGLAISEKMRSQIRGLNMATKNSQDAISLVQTAEGALQETQNMLQRMNELAVQAATGTNQEFDRTQAAKEFEQLKREINDVAESTTFNNMKVLDGSLSYNGYVRSASTAGVNSTIEDIASSTAKPVTTVKDASGKTGNAAEFASVTIGGLSASDLDTAQAAVPANFNLTVKVGNTQVSIVGATGGTGTSGAADATKNEFNVTAGSTVKQELATRLATALGSDYEVAVGSNSISIKAKNATGDTALKGIADNAITVSKPTQDATTRTGVTTSYSNADGTSSSGWVFAATTATELGYGYGAAATEKVAANGVTYQLKITDGNTGDGHEVILEATGAGDSNIGAIFADKEFQLNGNTYKTMWNDASTGGLTIVRTDTAADSSTLDITLLGVPGTLDTDLSRADGVTGNNAQGAVQEYSVKLAKTPELKPEAEYANRGEYLAAKEAYDNQVADNKSALQDGGTLTYGGKTYTYKETGAVAADNQFGSIDDLVALINRDFADDVTASKNADGNLQINAKQTDPSAALGPDTTFKALPGKLEAGASTGGAGTRTTVEFDIAKMRDGDEFTITAGDKSIKVDYADGDTRQSFMKKVEDKAAEIGGSVKGNALIIENKKVDVQLSTDSMKDTKTNAMRIQVGALENEQLGISIDSMNTAGLGLDNQHLTDLESLFNGDDQDAAGAAITATRDAINKVSDQRATLGAMQNRLDHKIANLKVSSENLSAAESRIRDVDMAQEMTNFTKNNILSQAATAMLAQANALPQNVLSLLG